jgi:glutathione S-transferase
MNCCKKKNPQPYTAPLNIEYWGIRGVGHHLRCMAFYLDLEFTETRLGMEDATSYFMRKNLSIDQGKFLVNLPNITDGDVFVSEASACIGYLLEKAGRTDMNNNTWQREQASSIVKHMFLGATMPCYEAADKEALCAKLSPEFESYATYQMAGLAKQLGYKEFLFGKDPVAADFALADFLEKVAAMDAELDLSTKLVKGNSNWEEYLARFFALPKIKEFRESDKCILRPFHPMMAFWGNK